MSTVRCTCAIQQASGGDAHETSRQPTPQVRKQERHDCGDNHGSDSHNCHRVAGDSAVLGVDTYQHHAILFHSILAGGYTGPTLVELVSDENGGIG